LTISGKPVMDLGRREVRNIDSFAINRLAVPGVVLMENAGKNTAQVIDDFLCGSAGRRIAVVAGSGNNAGDGFVVARHLAIRGGRVVTFLISLPEKLTGDARINYDILKNLKLPVEVMDEKTLHALAGRLAGFDLVVDAVGGTGIRGALAGAQKSAVEQINLSRKTVVAIDIPTGLDCDTGLADGPAVKADLTVTFVARKKGFSAGKAEQYTGKVIVADIGIPLDRVLELIGQGGNESPG